MDAQTHEFQVTEAARLDVAVARTLGWSRSKAQHAIGDGAVYVDGSRTRTLHLPVRVGQTVRVLPEAPDRTGVGGGGLHVVEERPGYVVVDKPAGLPTQPPPRGGDALSLRVQKWRVEQGREARLGEVHRLDRDVSGLVVYGLEPYATTALAEQFRVHTARRRYLALVRTAVPVEAVTIEEPIAELTPGRMTLTPTGMPAVTHLIPLAFDADARLALVLVQLETGRSHQVRLHLSWAVGAIAGDQQYGDVAGQDGVPRRIGLHAAALELVDPDDGRRREWTLEPPPDFWQLAGEARLDLPADWAQRQVKP